MSLGNRVKDPQGYDLSFDVTPPCISGTVISGTSAVTIGEHYTATRVLDPPLYYIVTSGHPGYSAPIYDAVLDHWFNTSASYKLYCWKFCPYSLEWRDHYHTTDPDTGLEVEVDGYYTTTDLTTGERFQYQVTLDKQTTHSGTVGRMAYHQRGRKAGFICVDPDCYYYTTAVSGTYFFQV